MHQKIYRLGQKLDGGDQKASHGFASIQTLKHTVFKGLGLFHCCLHI